MPLDNRGESFYSASRVPVVSVSQRGISVSNQRSAVSFPTVLAQMVKAQQHKTTAPIKPRRIHSQVRRLRGGSASGGRLDIRQSGDVGGSSQGCRVSAGGGTKVGGGCVVGNSYDGAG
jgi:hypothetical protein